MGRKSDIQRILSEKLDKLRTREEKTQIEVDALVSGKKNPVKSDFGLQCVDILKDIMSDVESSGADELRDKKKRVVQLQDYIEQSNLGKKEKEKLKQVSKKVQATLSSAITKKDGILKKATDIIGSLSVDVESVMSSAFGNDPILNLLGKGLQSGGSFAARKIKDGVQRSREKASSQRQSAKKDAESLLGKATKFIPSGGRPSGGDSPLSIPGGSGPGGGGSNEQFEANLQSIQDGISSILKITQDITSPIMKLSSDVRSMLGVIRKNVELATDMEERNRLMQEEQRREMRRITDHLKMGSGLGADSKGSQASEDGGFGITDFLIGEMVSQLLFKVVGKTWSVVKGMYGVAKFGTRVGMRALGIIRRGGLRQGLKFARRAFSMGLGKAGLMTGAKGLGKIPILGQILSPLLALLDGFEGASKAKEMGVSKGAGFLGFLFGGSFANKIINSIFQGLTWATIGGTIGTFIFPGPGTIIGAVLGGLIGVIAGYIGGEKLSKFFQSCFDWISGAFTWAWDMIKTAWDWSIGAIIKSAKWLGGKLLSAWKWVSGIAVGAWNTVTGAISDAWSWMKSAGETAWKTIEDYTGLSWDSITTGFSQGWETAKGYFSQAWGLITGTADSAWTLLSDGWNYVSTKFWEGVNTVKEIGGNLLSPIMEGVKKLKRWFVGVFDRFWGWVKKSSGWLGSFLGGDAPKDVVDPASESTEMPKAGDMPEASPPPAPSSDTTAPPPPGPASGPAPAPGPTPSSSSAGPAVLDATSDFMNYGGAEQLRVKMTGGNTDLVDINDTSTQRGQAFGGGKTHPGVLAFASAIQTALGMKLTRFTGFNDEYHQRSDKTKTSSHRRGLAMDFTLASAGLSSAAVEVVRAIAKRAGITPYIMDEYKRKSKGYTGDHIHVNFNSEADASKFLTHFSLKKNESQLPQMTPSDGNRSSAIQQINSAATTKSNVVKTVIAGGNKNIVSSREEAAMSSRIDSSPAPGYSSTGGAGAAMRS
jgi:hypothetical protein